ncbi:hypothetical protein NT1RE_10650 [Agrobacterium fabrum]|uniref:hypothetical protein n=1 Tax=Agrobacterium fabrum TaxID=1176649 RepID=UPI00138E1C16|nr:hypothetical protein [Agrobacterium fabrum]MCX2877463.1 hypothetical protein [Agrobacterium fabrum]NMV72880.1 hypothetical protein [Agrobacterium fabrum]QQN04864.1 hypothetical protein EML4058_09045 [Agrobacterium fabrum]QQN09927.1 hypothetical protein EML540_09055 [Agrobacterium fabrum]QQN15110.1 hypothetical protein EML485_09035 [Agrobacterium fabrum]
MQGSQFIRDLLNDDEAASAGGDNNIIKESAMQSVVITMMFFIYKFIDIIMLSYNLGIYDDRDIYFIILLIFSIK